MINAHAPAKWSSVNMANIFQPKKYVVKSSPSMAVMSRLRETSVREPAWRWCGSCPNVIYVSGNSDVNLLIKLQPDVSSNRGSIVANGNKAPANHYCNSVHSGTWRSSPDSAPIPCLEVEKIGHKSDALYLLADLGTKRRSNVQNPQVIQTVDTARLIWDESRFCWLHGMKSIYP